MWYRKRKDTDAMTLTLWLHNEANIQCRSPSVDKINDPFSKSSLKEENSKMNFSLEIISKLVD